MSREACPIVHVEVRGQLERVCSPIVWVLEIKLKSSGSAASTLTH